MGRGGAQGRESGPVGSVGESRWATHRGSDGAGRGDRTASRGAGGLAGERGHRGGRAGGAELRQDTLGWSARKQSDRRGATGSPSLERARKVLTA